MSISVASALTKRKPGQLFPFNFEQARSVPSSRFSILKNQSVYVVFSILEGFKSLHSVFFFCAGSIDHQSVYVVSNLGQDHLQYQVSRLFMLDRCLCLNIEFLEISSEIFDSITFY